MREHIFAMIEVAPGTKILGESLVQRRLHSVVSLASEAKLNPRTLRNVLAARGLIPAEDNAAGHHVFEAAAGERVAASIARSTKIASLPAAMNCTQPQAGQLVDEGMLDPIADGRRYAVGRTRKAIDNRDIERFLSALHASAQSVDMAADGMVTIAKAAEKAKLSCIEIVHLVLGGLPWGAIECVV
ncbi:hypothetical protein [Pontivivens nitratireducens]|uniref:hypothetical protein n=1 Tax=Pontivivens nitratireducens TaxID=2758038 RepID=UPI001639EB29|nr:hypothetical protein [Pontibrevibacter nitratireducens]